MRTKKLKLNDDVDRLLVVSDVHSFLTPLQEFDKCRAKLPGRAQVIVGGDLFLGGSQPVETLEWVQKNAGEFVVLGNHDENVLRMPSAGDYPIYTEKGAWQRLSGDQKDYLSQFPYKLEVRWRDQIIRLTHGHRDLAGRSIPGESFRSKPRELIDRYGDSKVALTILGHTHFSFTRKEGDIFLANSGTTCLPINAVREKDGTVVSQDDSKNPLSADVRGSFLNVTENKGELSVEIGRFDYDREAILEEIVKDRPTRLKFWKSWLADGIYSFH
ncbi:MAG: metallophosphoesterase family protein [Planctomycetes bacterium]|nr:metallophosphoesterase family protein [Planctomycetota bacterium]